MDLDAHEAIVSDGSEHRLAARIILWGMAGLLALSLFVVQSRIVYLDEAIYFEPNYLRHGYSVSVSTGSNIDSMGEFKPGIFFINASTCTYIQTRWIEK